MNLPAKLSMPPCSDRFSLHSIAAITCAICFAAIAAANEPIERPSGTSAEQERFFETEIRPLLIQACGDCHGARKTESGLRLDHQAGLLTGGDSGPVIDSHALGESLLLQVVGYEGDVQMPPDGKLSDEQIELLRRWVLSGAPWPEEAAKAANPTELRSGPITDQERQHWAYQSVRKPAVPIASLSAADELADWPHSDTDHFILSELVARGLRPADDADRRTWLRRLSFDVKGLPPTPEETKSFLADESPDAHTRVIDRYLNSPQYGERWGRHWLDIVRYADTAGDGADYPIREAYRYRNYVIDSFNADKPYDQFVREQIAGDILAHRAAAAGEVTVEQFAEQVTATGYVAVTNRFGYNINTEFQHLDIADTLDNLGQVFLGLSIGCARCHDHKYDAISAEDYYALYGIFSSSQYSFPGGEEHKRPHNLVPLVLPAEVAAAQQRVAAMVAELDERAAAIERERGELFAQSRQGVSRDPGLELQAQGKPGGSPYMTAGPNTILAEAQSPYTHVCPPGTQGIRITHGVPTDGLRQEFADVSAEQTPVFHFNLDFRNAEAAEGDGAYRFYLGRGAIQSLAFECSVSSRAFAVRDGDRFQVVRELEPGVWYNLQLSIDMTAKTFSLRIGSPGDIVELHDLAVAPGWDGVLNTFVSDGFGQDQSVSPPRDIDNIVGQLEPLVPLPDERPSVSSQREPAADAAAALASVKQRLGELVIAAEQVAKERGEAQASPDFPMAYGVVEGTPANARLQRRGEPDRLGAEVPRRFLEVLGGDPLPPDAGGSGRLELAHWLTRRSNPLTARVMVNRVWHKLFGRGLVDTPNDFGVRGEAPSHPELLDFLAAEFMEDGWSIKRLQRRILSSRVYRLASFDLPEQVAVDPENRWFARHRRRPLDAESIRDTMLAVSGQLNYASGGPHPFPDVNSWGFTIHYPFHAVYSSDHRSVYLMIQRSRRDPYLALFDAADPNISTASRQSTITPMQSLYLMNAPLVHAQASGFAQRVLASAEQHAGDRAAKTAAIKRAYLLALSRNPSEAEMNDAITFLDEAHELLQSSGHTSDQRPAWEALSRVLLTSNEFLYVD